MYEIFKSNKKTSRLFKKSMIDSHKLLIMVIGGMFFTSSLPLYSSTYVKNINRFYNDIDHYSATAARNIGRVSSKYLENLSYLAAFVPSYEQLLDLSFDVLDTERIEYFREKFKNILKDLYARY